MNYLVHHGIKGQRWGVKHGPPYPIDDDGPVTIKSGSKISSVSTSKKIKLDDRGVYGFDPSDEHDSLVYRGAYSTYLRWRRDHKKVFEHTFTTKEDLILPDHETKVKAFVDLYKNDKDFKSSYSNLEKIVKNSDSKDQYDEWAKSLSSGNVNWNTKYTYFMAAFNELPEMKESSKKFVYSLSKMGYNAILDDNNAGIYNKANSPLYVFEGQKSLKSTGRRKVSDKEIRDNTKKLQSKLGS